MNPKELHKKKTSNKKKQKKMLLQWSQSKQTKMDLLRMTQLLP